MVAEAIISVVLPAYNAAATIVRAIKSIRAQTFSDWELVIVDDGSTDATPDLVSQLKAEDPRIRLFSKPHEGLATALNAGIAAAQGPFIARMDADDESMPERFALQVEFLQANAGIGLVSCGVEFGGNRATNAGYALHVDWINSFLLPEQIELYRFIESPLAHPTVMFRRELADKFGGYRAGDFPEDYELWLRWLDAGVRMVKLPRALLRWNDLPTRLSRNDARYDPEAFFRTKAIWIARELPRVAVGRSIWIWGAGRPTRKRAAHLETQGVRIAGYIDVDAKKTTAALGGVGVPVVNPDRLPPIGDSYILGYVSSRGARELIRGTLNASGRAEGRDFLMCA
jgi:glycosyltransferase involved in cell wall biosynthesis